MIHFVLAAHTADYISCVEVWDDDQFIGTLYAGNPVSDPEGTTLKLITKHTLISQHLAGTDHVKERGWQVLYMMIRR